MRRIGVLVRTSTDRQREEKTIESQISEIKEWVKENDCVIVKRYADDGWSGDLLARPGLDGLRDDLSKDLWEAVVVVDRDRIARKYAYQELIIEEIKEAGKEFICLHQATPTSPEDKILQGFQGLFAEYEKAKISERMRRGKLRKAREKRVVHGPAPFGFRYILKTKERDGYFEINEEEARIVRKIFNWVGNDGLTIRQVIKRLYQEGVSPRKGKRPTWTNGPLCRLLRNESYIGTTYYNRRRAIVPKKPRKTEKYKRIRKSSREFRPKKEWIPIPVPKIIDKNLFRRVQEKLRSNQDILNMKNRKNDYLLAGFIYCSCGWKRVGEGVKNKNLYYRCSERIHSFPQPKKCRERGVNAKILDNIVWERIRELLSQPALIREQAKKWLVGQDGRKSVNIEEIKELEGKLDSLKEEEKRYLEAFGKELISLEAFSSLSKKIKSQVEFLEKRILELKKEENRVGRIPFSLNEICQKAQKVIKDLKFKEKREIIETILDRVIADQKTAIIKGFIPLLKGDYQNVKFWSICRNSGASQCREIDFV